MDTDIKTEGEREGSNSRLNGKLDDKSLMEGNQYEVESREYKTRTYCSCFQPLCLRIHTACYFIPKMSTNCRNLLKLINVTFRTAL